MLIEEQEEEMRNMSSKASILIVDDDKGMGETLLDIMEEIGYDADVAGDGFEAIEKAKNGDFDVILMDIKMPGMNGVQAFKEMRKILPEVNVVMMTAYAMEDLISEALQEGAYGVLYKPLEVEKVLNVVENLSSLGPILVIDDDPGVCEQLRDVLQRKGYNVRLAKSGAEAMDIVRQIDTQIVFVDVKLPTATGFEVYKAIKEINPRAMAIMMTGYHYEVVETADEPITGGAIACLYKPFDVNEIVRLVEEVSQEKYQGVPSPDN
jgi:two-component system response regulator HydG